MSDDLEARALRLMVKLETRGEHFSTTPITTKEGAALARLVLDLIREQKSHGHSYAASFGPGGQWDTTFGPVPAKEMP